ncbi:deoxynucleoside triphosphate triphosphohydrolase SAMHD1-like isoform X4 [Biomphalaria glabrata]|uniref:Deoxynucleoside triphosphate triphosphohydrolase SAMHD1-like isoform X4 n=1 Tax=Biomphalaria glabrata TaxID=6526 RepID=A0A9W3AUP6_BIOGL|nr:deoxynucleoside triphosphate triphosphohydrolase SAMHD1-like isoform X4 [Biomphalaria glabrata]
MKRSASQSRSEDVMATANKNKTFRLFNDPVHGHIELNEACQLIVDTKEFQRLRNIKQLGMVDFVFPGATHTRFEHALGTYHLAGKFLRSLREYHTEVPMKKKKTTTVAEEDDKMEISDISDKDILCVEIAGLCHDLGCGPLSTLFSKRFLVALEKNPALKDNAKVWLKNRNVLMFEHMLKMNSLEVKLKKFEIEAHDIIFIKELIGGYECNGSTAWPYKGRNEKNAFLYEIVSNHRNGVDVCKFDYMARDCHNLGIVNNFDAQRYVEFARIIEVDGEIQICTRNKELGNLYNMFFTRYNLHKFAYQHPVVCGMELMIVDVLEQIIDKFKILKVDCTEFILQAVESYMRLENERVNDILKAVKTLLSSNTKLNDVLEAVKTLLSLETNVIDFIEAVKTLLSSETKVNDVLEAVKTLLSSETKVKEVLEAVKTFLSSETKLNDVLQAVKTHLSSETKVSDVLKALKTLLSSDTKINDNCEAVKPHLSSETKVKKVLDDVKTIVSSETKMNDVLEALKTLLSMENKLKDVLTAVNTLLSSETKVNDVLEAHLSSDIKLNDVVMKTILSETKLNDVVMETIQSSETKKEAIEWISKQNTSQNAHSNDEIINNLLAYLNMNTNDRISSVCQAIQEFLDKTNIETCQWLTIQEVLNFEVSQDVVLRGFTHLTDDVLFSIRNFKPDVKTDVELKKRVQLIERLYSRDIYKFLGESLPMYGTDLDDKIESEWSKMPEDIKTLALTDEEKMQQIIYNKCNPNKAVTPGSIFLEDIKLIITKLDFGMKDENPIHRLRVYQKGNLHEGIKLEQTQTSLLLQGMNYKELLVRVYTTLPNKDGRNAEKIKAIKAAFESMIQRNN